MVGGWPIVPLGLLPRAAAAAASWDLPAREAGWSGRSLDRNARISAARGRELAAIELAPLARTCRKNGSGTPRAASHIILADQRPRLAAVPGLRGVPSTTTHPRTDQRHHRRPCDLPKPAGGRAVQFGLGHSEPSCYPADPCCAPNTAAWCEPDQESRIVLNDSFRTVGRCQILLSQSGLGPWRHAQDRFP
jgi:hypothetical protein